MDSNNGIIVITGILLALQIIAIIGLIFVWWVISGLIVDYLPIQGVWIGISQFSITLYLTLLTWKITYIGQINTE